MLYQLAADLVLLLHAGAEAVVPRLQRAAPLVTRFPDSPLGRHLADTASLIRLDLGIPVFKVALGSFDTHFNQKPTHARLLHELAQGLLAFRQEMIAAGRWGQVVLMTYSEFGRRAAQNGSGGTDHGAAATQLVLGGAVRGGHVGTHPDLRQLVNMDMQYSTDFRQLYQTIWRDWWRQPQLALPGGWETLPLFRAAS